MSDNGDKDEDFKNTGGSLKTQTKEEKIKAKYAEKNADFKVPKGIEMDRGCTDIFCLILFVVFLGSLFACLGYGIKKGNIAKFTAPIDLNNRFCGHQGQINGVDYDHRAFKYLFLEDLSVGSSSIFS